MTDLAFPKPTPADKARKQRRAARERLDKLESDKVRTRSHGRCEVVISSGRLAGPRCPQRAAHVHHLQGGNGRRGRGSSALAENKLAVCARCHTEIHEGRLAVKGKAGAWVFERVR